MYNISLESLIRLDLSFLMVDYVNLQVSVSIDCQRTSIDGDSSGIIKT